MQLGATFVVLFITYMAFAILDYKGGFDSFVGFAIFQPLFAIIISIITITTCFIVGLPIRLNRRLNEWWRNRMIFQIVAVILGILIVVISFVISLNNHIKFNGDGIAEIEAFPNLYMFILGWFITAFSILHFFPPIKRNIYSCFY